MKRFGILMFAVSLLALGVLSGIDTPTAYADFKFGEAVNLGPTVNSVDADYGACLSPDGLELYFSSNRGGGYGNTDIWVSTRASVQYPWGTPVNLGPEINTGALDQLGSISADGLVLYFDSGFGLITATRATTDAPWGSRALVRFPPGSTRYADANPVISADGLELFFSSCLDNKYLWQLWVTTRATTSDPWGTPVNLHPTVTPGSGGNTSPTWISPDGLKLFLSSDSPGFGLRDIWMTSRPSKADAWGPARNLGRGVNTIYSDFLTAISPDGQWAYIGEFFGPRPGGVGAADILQAPIIPMVDFNNDGKVDIEDLLRMIESWGKNDPSVDIGPYAWGDGKVDANDLEVLMSYWGQEVEVDDPTLIARWRFDESQGSLAMDSAGSYDASLKGNPVWQPAGGKLAGALLLDGKDDYGDAPAVVDPGRTTFSVFAWVKGGKPGQVILSQLNKANWLCAAEITGMLTTELKRAGSLGTDLQSQAVITDGNWHKVGLTWDRSNRILYVDDVQVAADTQGSLPSSGTHLNIGAGCRLTGGTFWSGLIDDVRIYNRAVKP